MELFIASTTTLPETQEGIAYRVVEFSEGDLHFDRYRIVKETPKGFRIHLYGDKTRFILNDSVKQFASRSPKIALEKYIHRKNKHLYYLNKNINRVIKGRNNALELLETLKE